MRSIVAFVLFAGSVAAAQTAAPSLPFQNPALSAHQRAVDLVGRMTLEEKATELEDWGEPIPRLGVPSYQTWSEALHGVARAGYATVFPQAIGMAATWDPKIVEDMGDVIAFEGRAKYNQAQREGNHRIFYGLTFWSPNINIFRDPRWGRGQETYGEDPFLTGVMGSAFIRGLQGPDPEHPKVVATSKHYAVHSGPESTRHTANVEVSAHDLEDTYLPAFRTTVVDAKVKSVMCAYNAIDGHAACANTMLLKDYLRDAWGFKGFVVSDCGAIVDVYKGHKDTPDIEHAAAASLKAGTDLSCSIWGKGFNTLAQAVKDGLVSEADVTQAAERLFTARMELGMFDPPGTNPQQALAFSEVASDASRAKALQAAEESIVLLKNKGVLPLKPSTRRIAVVGPTAELLASLEGNYNGRAKNPVTPLEGVQKQFAGATIRYAQGAPMADGFRIPVPRTAFGSGLQAEFFNTADWSGSPVATTTEPRIDYNWTDSAPVPQITGHDYAVRWTGTFQAPAPGSYTLVLQSSEAFPYSPRETYKLTLDGKVLGERALNGGKPNMGDFQIGTGANPSAPPIMSADKPARLQVEVTDTRPHPFVLEYSHSGDQAGGGVTLSWEPPQDALLAEAVAAARDSDVVLAFTGLSPKLEGEEMPVKIEGFAGGDRTSIELPGAQQRLLEAVGATGKPVIVVNLSGSAIALRWASEHAAAAVQAWYPGVDGGTAVAHMLAGVSNPAGRLPVTFYADTNDLPPFDNYSMKNRTYRYYAGKPLYGFGYGLSYTTFSYGPVKLSTPTLHAGDALSVEVDVKNTGKLAGDEVAELYLVPPGGSNGDLSPRLHLGGFQRISLKPGEIRRVRFNIDPRTMSEVDAQGVRSVQPGSYQVAVGGAQPKDANAPTPAQTASFTIEGTQQLPK